MRTCWPSSTRRRIRSVERQAAGTRDCTRRLCDGRHIKWTLTFMPRLCSFSPGRFQCAPRGVERVHPGPVRSPDDLPIPARSQRESAVPRAGPEVDAELRWIWNGDELRVRVAESVRERDSCKHESVSSLGCMLKCATMLLSLTQWQSPSERPHAVHRRLPSTEARLLPTESRVRPDAPHVGRPVRVQGGSRECLPCRTEAGQSSEEGGEDGWRMGMRWLGRCPHADRCSACSRIC
jgi:hypothetical protein